MVLTARPQNIDDSSFALVQATLASCSRAVGDEFFPAMVEALAEALCVRWVVLSSIHRNDRKRLSTIAIWDSGLRENFEHWLDHSPLAVVVAQDTCCFPARLTALFPNDPLLREMNAESYVGTPLRSSSGEILGVLSALDDKPMSSAPRMKEIVELFSGRAAAELERLATASLNERLGRIVEDSISEVYVFDGDDYHFELVNRGARENLGYSMEELRRLTPWELKPEFTKDQFLQFIAPLKNGEVPNLLFETVHERKDGSHYNVAVQLQFFPGIENLFYASISDITDRKHAEQAQAHLAAIVASSSEAIISKTLEGTVKSWNRAAEKIFGYSAEEMIGQSIRLLIPSERQAEEDAILDKISRAEMISNYETVRLCRDGSMIDVSVNVSPIFDGAGKVIGASKIAHDIGERKRAEERERLLIGEVNHRAKNMLTLVQVIARQTAASDSETFAKNFEQRIFALSASHDLLVNSGWQDILLEDLVRSQLEHFRDTLGSRIRLSGPQIKISAPAAQAIGMAVHELATNAGKYGALSNKQGVVTISWRLDQAKAADSQFVMHWVEEGGPPVERPKTSGFGSTVIDRLLTATLQGEVEVEWRATGLVCQVSCPPENLLSKKKS